MAYNGVEFGTEGEPGPGSTSRLFLTSALVWFLVTSLVGVLYALVRVLPYDFAGSALAADRLRAVYLSGSVYVWLAQAFVGAATAIAPLVLDTHLWSERLGVWTGWLWNLFGVLMFASILGGQYEPRPLAESVWPLDLLLVGLALLALVNLFMTVRRRREPRLYASVWYFVAAFLWFIGGSSVGKALFLPGDGWQRSTILSPAADLILQGFQVQVVLFLWLAPLSFGAAYLLIPALSGRPLYSRRLARFGFWGLAVLGGAGGQQFHLLETAPIVLATLTPVAAAALTFPFLVTHANLMLTLRDRPAGAVDGTALKLVTAGAGAWLIVALENAVQALPPVNRFFFGTVWQQSFLDGAVLGAGSLIGLAAAGHVLPRLIGRPLPSRTAYEAHFRLVTAGFLTVFLALQAAAIVQGSGRRLGLPLDRISEAVLPFWVLYGMGAAAIATGAAVQGWNVYRLMGSAPEERATQGRSGLTAVTEAQ